MGRLALCYTVMSGTCFLDTAKLQHKAPAGPAQDLPTSTCFSLPLKKKKKEKKRLEGPLRGPPHKKKKPKKKRSEGGLITALQRHCCSSRLAFGANRGASEIRFVCMVSDLCHANRRLFLDTYMLALFGSLLSHLLAIRCFVNYCDGPSWAFGL